MEINKTWAPKPGELGGEADRQTNHFNSVCLCHMQKYTENRVPVLT